MMANEEFSRNSGPKRYEIRFRGKLHPRWETWFDGFCLESLADGVSVLRGDVPDTTGLYGVLDRLRDLNLELIEVKEVL